MGIQKFEYLEHEKRLLDEKYLSQLLKGSHFSKIFFYKNIVGTSLSAFKKAKKKWKPQIAFVGYVQNFGFI